MKKLLNTINSKMITAQIRVNEALNNDKGMEVIQFLAIALVGIAIAGFLVGFGKDYVEQAIKNVGGQITTQFPAGT